MYLPEYSNINFTHPLNLLVSNVLFGLPNQRGSPNYTVTQMTQRVSRVMFGIKLRPKRGKVTGNIIFRTRAVVRMFVRLKLLKSACILFANQFGVTCFNSTRNLYPGGLSIFFALKNAKTARMSSWTIWDLLALTPLKKRFPYSHSDLRRTRFVNHLGAIRIDFETTENKVTTGGRLRSTSLTKVRSLGDSHFRPTPKRKHCEANGDPSN